MAAQSVIIGGDINIHVEDPTDINGINLMELLSSVDLQQHVTLPTQQAGGILIFVISMLMICALSHRK